MLGAGVLLAPAPAMAAAGRWLPLSVLLAVATAACTAVAATHQGAIYRSPAPSYACTRARLGVVPGRISASTSLVGQIAATAVLGRLVAELLFPAAPAAMAPMVILGSVVATVAGARIRGGVAWAWLAVTLATPVLVAATGFAIAPPEAPAATPSSAGALGVTGAAGVLCFAFFAGGRASTPDAAGGGGVGGRVAALSLLGTTGALVLFLAACVHQLGSARLALSENPLRDVLTAAAASDLVPLVSSLAAVGLLPALLAALDGVRGTARAVLEERDLPGVLGRTGGSGRPYLLDLSGGVLAACLAALLGPVSAMVFAACCLLVHCALTNASARLSLHDRTAPRVWAARTTCAGMGLSVVLFMSMPVHALLATAGTAAAGPIVAGVYTRRWS
ncbi:amino acid permease [Salinifilum ghardaiensis]